MLIPIGFDVAFVAIVAVAIRAEIRCRGKSSYHFAATAAAVAIALVFYPMTIAPTGATANGGLLGFLSLVIASGFSWVAFASNRKSAWVRTLIQLPVTALVTFMAIHDAYCQSVSGWWRGF